VIPTEGGDVPELAKRVDLARDIISRAHHRPDPVLRKRTSIRRVSKVNDEQCCQMLSYKLDTPIDLSLPSFTFSTSARYVSSRLREPDS
jgi:hypothetical protein